MSRRLQRTKAKEGVPTEEKEDSGSDSSAFDKDHVTETLRKMDENFAARLEESEKRNEEKNEDFKNEFIARNNEVSARRDEVFKNELMKMFQDLFIQAKEGIQQENEARLQQESTKLEAMVEYALELWIRVIGG